MRRWLLGILVGCCVGAGPGLAIADPTGSITTLSPPGGAGRTSWVRTEAPGLMALGPVGTIPVGLLNGAFDDGLLDWVATQSGGGSSPGAVTDVAGAARFLEGDSFLVTLEQTFLLPAFASELTFHIDIVPGFDTSAGFLPDAFEMSLLDANLLPVIAPWTVGASAAFNLQEDLTVATGSEVTWDAATGQVTIDVTGVPAGVPVTLYFDFIGADSDELGGVTLDDVSLVIDPPVGSFQRGDLDGSGVVDATDLVSLLDRVTFVTGGTAALDCTGAPLFDGVDANDNEVVTIADYLRLRRALEAGATLPAPALYCDYDPDDDLDGFDAVDPDYAIAAGEVSVEPASGVVDRDVFLPVLVESAQNVTGLTVILDFDSTLLTPFDPVLGDGDPFVTSLGNAAVHVEPDRLVVTVWSANEGELLVPGAAGVLQEVGVIQFHLADFATFPPIDWQTDTLVGADLVRATVVTEDGRDHQPTFFAGSGAFVRGDANDDAQIDISDTVFVLNYLFVSGDAPPCLDAADLNNDGGVDISDTVYLLNFLFISGPAIPTPSPACGFDVGAIDALDCAESMCQ